jgi:endonuclease-3 related protein
MLAEADVRAVFARLSVALGPQQRWWPQRDGAIEVCAGAILVQHTAWRSAALAIEALRGEHALSWQAWRSLPEDALAGLVRAAGIYRAKARTLRAFAECAEAHDGLDGLLAGSARAVRSRLLGVRGIGDETADAITLYAARKPTFVVDVYARRLFATEAAPLPARIDDARRLVTCAAEHDVATLQEWHALAVEHGRTFSSRSGRGDS